MGIKIEWLSDSYECDTCGVSFADGARVTIDGDKDRSFELIPVAHCFGGDHWTSEEVYQKIIQHLGWDIEYVE